MTEEEQNAGWWVASDGKSYPPEQHPDYQAPAPSSPPPPQPGSKQPGLPPVNSGPAIGSPGPRGGGFGGPPPGGVQGGSFGSSAGGSPAGGFGSPRPGGGFGSPTGGFGGPTPAGYGGPPVSSPPTATSNVLAVISFVAGLAGFCFWGIGGLVAIVLGHIAISQLKKPDNHQSGRGFAVAGLCLGYFQLVSGIAFAAIVLLAGGTIRDENTAVDCRIEFQNVKLAAGAAYVSGQPVQSVQELVDLGYLGDNKRLGTYNVSGRDVTQLECPAS